MARIEESLLFAAQCRFMAECAVTTEEHAEWASLAKHWLNEAGMDLAKAKGETPAIAD